MNEYIDNIFFFEWTNPLTAREMFLNGNNLYSNCTTGVICIVRPYNLKGNKQTRIMQTRYRNHFPLFRLTRLLSLSLPPSFSLFFYIPLSLSVFSLKWETWTSTLQHTVTIATCEIHSLSVSFLTNHTGEGNWVS